MSPRSRSTVLKATHRTSGLRRSRGGHRASPPAKSVFPSFGRFCTGVMLAWAAPGSAPHRADAIPGHRLLAGASLVAMSGSTTCPGCGLQLPASGLPWDPRRNASPECWQLYGEVQGFELEHLELVRDLHQLTVDAYAAQHAPREAAGEVPPISVAYALVGLHLALDRGASGGEVRVTHQRMGKP